MSATVDPAAPLTPSGNLRRRLLVSHLVSGASILASFVAVAVLALVVFDVAKQGATALSWSFITKNPVGLAGGGIANAIIGSTLIITFATLIALPVGVLTALYLTEYSKPTSRSARALRTALDLLQGVPTIVVGLFVFGLMVEGHGDSGFAGSVALSIVMLPLIARSSQEVLLLVPGTLREAADALGVERWRAILTVVLPAAAGGIVTGAILAVARAAGETAPLLLADSIYPPNSTQLLIFGHGVPNIPVLILTASNLGIPEALARGWGAAFVLLGLILIANIGARLLLARYRARLGQ
ncbi:MAG: phosphate ABC transporter permease PstA [Solirubrobacteraceae bacterium]